MSPASGQPTVWNFPGAKSEPISLDTTSVVHQNLNGCPTGQFSANVTVLLYRLAPKQQC